MPKKVEVKRSSLETEMQKRCGTCKHFDRCKSDIVIGAKLTDTCHWGSLHKLKSEFVNAT
jgi:hypothetical protein